MNKHVIIVLLMMVTNVISAQPETERYVYFTKGQQATIILPITPDRDKGIYYKLDRCENSQIIFVEEPNPQAFIPYIIIPKEDFNIDLCTLDLEGYLLGEVEINGISFTGYYHTDYVGCRDGYYYIIIDNTPDCSKEDRNNNCPIIGALRAYIEVDWRLYPGEIIEEISLRDNTTCVKHLSVQSLNGGRSIYNLAGKRVNASYKGIVIQNGRKVIAK